MSEKYNKRVNSISRIIFVFLIISLIISLSRNISRAKEAKNRVNRAATRLEKVKQENLELSNKLETIKGEEYIEEQLRDSLGLAKDEEIVLVLPEDDVLRKLAPKMFEEEQILPEPNWKKWLNLFL